MLAKEREMLDYAAQGRPIEAEYLSSKVQWLIDTKKKEVDGFKR
jgi:hypothetical protein